MLDLDKWAALIDRASTPVPPVWIGADVSPDRRRASIAIAGLRVDGDLHTELSDNGEGVGWLLPRLKQLVEDHDPLDIVCDASQAILAEQVWNEVGIRPTQLDRAELSAACGYFVDAVEEGRLRHLGDPLLLDAIRGATTSNYGGDGWVFSRRSSERRHLPSLLGGDGGRRGRDVGDLGRRADLLSGNWVCHPGELAF